MTTFAGGGASAGEGGEPLADRGRGVLPVDQVPDAGEVDPGAVGQRRGERVGVGRRQHPAAGRVGEVIGVQVIPRPHEDLGAVLPLAGKKAQPATVS